MKEIKLSKKAEKEMERLKKEIGLDKLEEMEKEMTKNVPLMDMYCLCCGKLVCKDYKGQLWDSVCMCHFTNMPQDEYLKILGTKEYHKLHDHIAKAKCCHIKEGKNEGSWNMPIAMSYANSFSHLRCKSCKNEEEHIERKIQDYLGKDYKDIKPKQLAIQELKKTFIEAIRNKCIKDRIEDEKDGKKERE